MVFRGITNIFFFLILKTEHNFSLLIQTLKTLTILGTLKFLIYINDLNYSVNFCKFHHLTDDTNLINFNCSIKVNIGLKIQVIGLVQIKTSQ